MSYSGTAVSTANVPRRCQLMGTTNSLDTWFATAPVVAVNASAIDIEWDRVGRAVVRATSAVLLDYRCTCAAGFRGTHCEHRSSPARRTSGCQQPCGNHSICMEGRAASALRHTMPAPACVFPRSGTNDTAFFFHVYSDARPSIGHVASEVNVTILSGNSSRNFVLGAKNAVPAPWPVQHGTCSQHYTRKFDLSTPPVRLATAAGAALWQSFGRVEVRLQNGLWGYIEPTRQGGWDSRAADVVCRQLGFGRSTRHNWRSHLYGPPTGPAVFADVQCHGLGC